MWQWVVGIRQYMIDNKQITLKQSYITGLTRHWPHRHCYDNL